MSRHYRTLVLLCLALVLALVATACSARAGSNEAASARPFPEEAFPLPEREANIDYLGLSSVEGVFTVEEVDADYLLVQIFNVYCPHCQAEAEEVEVLAESIRSRQGRRLKFLAVAIGNSPFEISIFRDKYDLSFPITRDQDYVLYEKLGQPGTPSYYLLKLPGDPAGEARIVYSRIGRFFDREDFYRTVLQKTGEGE